MLLVTLVVLALLSYALFNFVAWPSEVESEGARRTRGGGGEWHSRGTDWLLATVQRAMATIPNREAVAWTAAPVSLAELP